MTIGRLKQLIAKIPDDAKVWLDDAEELGAVEPIHTDDGELVTILWSESKCDDSDER